MKRIGYGGFDGGTVPLFEILYIDDLIHLTVRTFVFKTVKYQTSSPQDGKTAEPLKAVAVEMGAAVMNVV